MIFSESELRKLLPSALVRVLKERFFKCLEASKLDCYNNPTFKLADALRSIDAESGSYIALLIPKCFEAAEKEYERVHPLGWDNELQRSFRVGINDPKKEK